MSPIAINNDPSENLASSLEKLCARPVDVKKSDIILPPANTRRRYAKAGIDISNGYPFYPPAPEFVHEVKQIRTELRDYVDPATRADPKKAALFGAAKEVRNLGVHIGVGQSVQPALTTDGNRWPPIGDSQ